MLHEAVTSLVCGTIFLTGWYPWLFPSPSCIITQLAHSSTGTMTRRPLGFGFKIIILLPVLLPLSCSASPAQHGQRLRRSSQVHRAAAGGTTTTVTELATRAPATLGDDVGRPAWVVYPHAYPDSDKKWPLIMMLHGYGSDSYYHDHFLGISARVNSHGFIALLPNGTENSQGRHFWNGLRCCNFENATVDDVSYLVGLIEEAVSRLKVDPKRVHLVGHSNGGAMTQILGCWHAELFNSIASVTPGEIPSPCLPSHPVSILEVCASEDPIVKPDLCNAIIGNWTQQDACSLPSLKTKRDYDCDASRPVGDNTDGNGFQFNQWHGQNCLLPGNETEVTEWEVCGGSDSSSSSSVAFWNVVGAEHNPGFSHRFQDDLVEWLLNKTYVEPSSKA